jgi:hypothetical protein
VRLIRAWLTYAYWTTLKRYCFQHDVITWKWTHRDCCARQRAIGARLAGLLDRESE